LKNHSIESCLKKFTKIFFVPLRFLRSLPGCFLSLCKYDLDYPSEAVQQHPANPCQPLRSGELEKNFNFSLTINSSYWMRFHSNSRTFLSSKVHSTPMEHELP